MNLKTKSTKSRWSLLFSIPILLMFLVLGSVVIGVEVKVLHQQKHAITPFKYSGHDYLLYRVGSRSGLTHNPDCIQCFREKASGEIKYLIDCGVLQTNSTIEISESSSD